MSLERFSPYVLTRDWGTETIIAQTSVYLGKLLVMQAGTAGGLQYHTEKDETFHLLVGVAFVETVVDGQLVSETMSAGQSFHIPPGTVHRVKAVTKCLFVETSTPHFDDRVRCEALVGESELGGLPTTKARE